MKGLIFGPDSVRANLDGRKTQTRLVVKPQPCHPLRSMYNGEFFAEIINEEFDLLGGNFMPLFKVGDVFYQKEAYRPWFPEDDDGQPLHNSWVVRYRADDAVSVLGVGWDEGPCYCTPYDLGLHVEPATWKSPIFMPQWAARFYGRIVAVRVERLQEISEGDAIAEGIEDGGCLKCGHPEKDHPVMNCPCMTAEPDYRDSFIYHWDRINGKSHPWDSNPWVWVYEYERTEQ